MIFYVDAKELASGVLSVIKALPVRTSMPILEGIYVEAGKDGIRLKCSDLMLQKECVIPATVEEEGKVIIPAKLFSEVVRKLPDSICEIRQNAKSVDLKCGRAKSSIQCIEFEEFPEMRFEGDTFDLTIDREECRDMILETVFATAQDDTKPILTGALLEISDRLSLVATDAYQFAMRTVPLKAPADPRELIIPGKSLLEIARMMDEAQEKAVLTFTKTHVKVDLTHSVLVARLLDGDYIKYKQILPKEYKTRVIIGRNELMESIDRAQLMAREGNNNIVMHFSGNLLSITANSYAGKINEEVEAQIVGDDIDIAFNPKYCMNILKVISDEKVVLDFVSPISPCVVHPLQGDRYYYLIVPVRIYAQF